MHSEQCEDAPVTMLSPIRTRSRSRWPIMAVGRPFWIFFAAALFLDFGFDLYLFLYNLFLVNLHYDERAIGLIGSALTIGNLVATIPVSMLASRLGLRKVLLFCFIGAPLICIVRPFLSSIAAQLVLSFLTGAALCSWPVCFAPVVAKLTDNDTRVFAFSITFATGIGTGMLAGLAGGYLPTLLNRTNMAGPPITGMRFVLIGASLIAMLGAVPVWKLKIDEPAIHKRRAPTVLHPFLLRFLPAFALWSLVTGSFGPFAPVYFQKHLGFSLQHVGLVFSAAELVQFCAVLLVPILYRRIGVAGAILTAQAATGIAALLLGVVHSHRDAVACYLIFMASQFTAGPGFYGMLMSRMTEAERYGASAMQNVVGALSGAAASSLTGILIVHFGYTSIFHLTTILAVGSVLLFFALLSAQPDTLIQAPDSPF